MDGTTDMSKNILKDQFPEETRLKQRTAIISAISRAFSEMYYISLKDHTIQKITSQNLLQYQPDENKDARMTLRMLADTQVVGAFRPIMRNFMDVDTMDERLGNKSILSQEYVNEKGEWIRCSLMPAERDESGKNLSVVCILRQITAEKEELASQDNLIQALAIPYENTYVVHADTGEAVCYRMGQTMMERYGHKFAVGSYEQNIRNYIDNDVLEEDRMLFEQLRSLKSVEKLLSDRKTYYFNYRVFRNNEIRYYQCQLVKPSAHRNEFVVGFKCVDDEKQQEVIQQRKLEEALAQVEKANSALQEEMAISEALSQEYHSLFKIDAASGKMTLYRTDGIGMKKETVRKLMELVNYDGGVLDKYIESFVAPEDQERVRNSTRLAVLKQKVPDKGLFKIGFRRILNGVSSYYEMNTVKITDKNGRVTFIMGMRDVDTEVRSQLKQSREMELQREIIEGLGSEYFSVLLVDAETDHVTVFREEGDRGKSIARFCHRYHNCWSEFILAYAKEAVSDTSRAEFSDKLSREFIRSGENAYSLTYEYVTENGIVYYQVRVAFVHKTDGTTAVVGTRNVDDLIKKERQQEMELQKAYITAEKANDAKTTFLLNMSHDIRTPMNAILGYSRLMRERITSPELIHYQDMIEQSGNLLLSIINNVLDMARIESGKMELDENYNQVGNIVSGVCGVFEMEARQKNLTIEHVVHVKHHHIICDSTKMQEVLTNIFSNAVKYTPPGGKIMITTQELPCDREGYINIQTAVEDTGIGMSKEFLPQLFSLFSRERNTTAAKVMGSGLGMAIVKSLVDLMGGTIEVESQLGKGSKFTVTVPHKIATAEYYEKKTLSEYREKDMDFSGKRALLA